MTERKLFGIQIPASLPLGWDNSEIILRFHRLSLHCPGELDHSLVHHSHHCVLLMFLTVSATLDHFHNDIFQITPPINPLHLNSYLGVLLEKPKCRLLCMKNKDTDLERETDVSLWHCCPWCVGRGSHAHQACMCETHVSGHTSLYVWGWVSLSVGQLIS